MARAADPQFSEYEIKGAFLAKFAMFVDWPEKTFPDKQSPAVIGVLGEDPFGPQFEAALSKGSLNGRPFALKRFKTAKEAVDCQMLFVSASEKERLPLRPRRRKSQRPRSLGHDPSGSEAHRRGSSIN